MPDLKPQQWSRLRYWIYCWYKTLTLPGHIKRALREPLDPSEFIEVHSWKDILANDSDVQTPEYRAAYEAARKEQKETIAELAAIRERDASYGEQLPKHWQAQWDRRTLLRLLDDD